MSTALLIVDVQRGMFDDPNFKPFEGAATVERISGLLGYARSTGVPVFFVQHDGGAEDTLSAGKPGFPFLEELTPQRHEDVTVKYECDAFERTALADKLRASGIDRLVVCGMQTDMCVNAAVRAAAKRGFEVTLVSDAHTTFDTETETAQQIIGRHNTELAACAAVVPSVNVEL